MKLTEEQIEAVADALRTAQVELGDCADFLSELASRGLKIVPVEEWRPIETAPRDGTPVLVCDEHTGSMRWAVWDGDWMDGHRKAGGMISGCPCPTHWMPLPVAPETAGESG